MNSSRLSDLLPAILSGDTRTVTDPVVFEQVVTATAFIGDGSRLTGLPTVGVEPDLTSNSTTSAPSVAATATALANTALVNAANVFTEQQKVLGSSDPNDRLYLRGDQLAVVGSDGNGGQRETLLRNNQVEFDATDSSGSATTASITFRDNTLTVAASELVVPAPVSGNNAATKQYVDDAVAAAGGGGGGSTASPSTVDDTKLVHLAGDETITGAKTFAHEVVVSNSSQGKATMATDLFQVYNIDSIQRESFTSQLANGWQASFHDPDDDANPDGVIASIVLQHTGRLDIIANEVTVPAPVNGGNPATKQYVDNAVAGAARGTSWFKPSSLTTLTANATLTPGMLYAVGDGSTGLSIQLSIDTTGGASGERQVYYLKYADYQTGFCSIDFQGGVTVAGKSRLILYPGDFLVFSRDGNGKKACTILEAGSTGNLRGNLLPSTNVKSAVTSGSATWQYGELQGTQPAGSQPNQSFCDRNYRYLYTNGSADANGDTFVWIRLAKA